VLCNTKDEFLKYIIILIGPKGSGKTTIGRAIAKEMDIRFFDVEKHLIEYMSNHLINGNDLPNHGFDIEEIEIRSILKSEVVIIIEATGSSEFFMRYYNMYSEEFKVIPIKVTCNYKTCLERINKRGFTDNFEVPIDKIKSIYDHSTALNLDWFHVIETANDFSIIEIVGKLKKCIGELNA